MNILFVNYGGPENNSMNHIAGFADGLGQAGHDCVVAVIARAKKGPELWPEHRFRCINHRDIGAAAPLFANGRPADLVHAWTPRETVRRAVFAHFRQALRTGGRPTLLIHLEDNEEAIIERSANRPIADLLTNPQEIPPSISHPRIYREFLAVADGVTVIIRPLAEFVPPEVPWEELWPGIHPQLFEKIGEERRLAVREEIGLPPGARMITYTGNASSVNRDDMVLLYSAVRELNERGVACRLVRTGTDDPAFLSCLPFDPAPFLINQGFVAASRIPELLQAADLLLQPGAPDAFNTYRLPSKVPEFLASGRPVVLPAANIGLHMEDGRHALLTQSADVSELVAAATRILENPRLADALSTEGRAFAQEHFARPKTCARLSAFHQAIQKQASQRSRGNLRALLKPPPAGPLAEMLRHDGMGKEDKIKRPAFAIFAWEKLKKLWHPG
jgi:glycosyltransferase involved in cell wall biosynthesis